MKSLGQGPELIKQSGAPTRPAPPHPLCQDAVCLAVFLLAPGQAGSGDGVHTMGWSPLAQCPDPVRAPLPAGSGPALQRDHVEDVAGTGLPREKLGVTDGGVVSPLQGERMTGAVR